VRSVQACQGLGGARRRGRGRSGVEFGVLLTMFFLMLPRCCRAAGGGEALLLQQKLMGSPCCESRSRDQAEPAKRWSRQAQDEVGLERRVLEGKVLRICPVVTQDVRPNRGGHGVESITPVVAEIGILAGEGAELACGRRALLPPHTRRACHRRRHAERPDGYAVPP